MRITENGKVIIGTHTQTTGTHTDYKFSVDGKIVAKKVVTTELNWADDELQKKLTLDDLKKEEDFVKQYNHLNGIPSGTEIEKNGIEIGEMSALQMRKVEQLFKYSFLFNNEVKLLKKENKNLKQQNETMQKQINDLSKRIELLEKQ